MEFLRKYGVAAHIYIPIPKRAVVDDAVGADWTPAAGDVKISKGGGAASNVTNLPSAITMGNTAMWDFSLTATEMQAAVIAVSVSDSATKAVEDQFFLIGTYGNASALHAADFNDSVRLGLTALPNAAAEAAGGLFTRGSGAGQINQANNGQVDVNAARTGGTTNTGRDIGASVLLSPGTGAGQLSLSSGAVLLQATQTGVTIPTVTTLANAPSDSSGTTTLLTRLTSTRAGLLDNLSNLDATISGIAAAVWGAGTRTLTAIADSSGVTTLLGKFAGITLVAQWLGLIAGKQTGNATARTELRATGAGSGTFDETTDSQEALRDRGDSAWTTATPPTAAAIADAVWDEATAGHATAGTTGKALTDAGGAGTPPSAADIADAVWDEAQSGHVGAGTFGAYLDASVSGVSTGGVSAGDIADAVLDEVLSGHATAGTLGKAIADIDSHTDTETGATAIRAAVGLAAANLDTQLAAKASQTSVDDVPTNAELATALGTADDAVLAAISGLNNLSQAQAQTAAAAALTAYDPPTHAEMTAELASADDGTLAAIAALNNLSAAQVNAEVDTALADYDGPTHTEMTAELATSDDAVLAAIAALNNLSSVGAQAAAAAALAAYGAAKTSELPAVPTANQNASAVLAAATATPIASNVEQVNNVALQGNGTGGNPWRPA